MNSDSLLNKFLKSDEIFNSIFPTGLLINLMSHLTPLPIAIAAAAFLTQGGNNNIVDIGSGPGKFCLIGACTTEARYTGIERRDTLSDLARILAKKYQLDRIKFIGDNISNIDFSVFDGFYLFNPFYENLETEARMDQQFAYSYKLYQKYTDYVKQQLAEMPLGTKVAAFHGYHNEIPNSFRAQEHSEFSHLKLFTKKFRGG
jgi:predicted RNA methylase